MRHRCRYSHTGRTFPGRWTVEAERLLSTSAQAVGPVICTGSLGRLYQEHRKRCRIWGPPPSPSQTREVLMRRAAALAFIPLLAAGVVLAGCASSSSSKPAAPPSSDPYQSVTVSGAFNKSPTVTIPKVTGTGPLYTKTVIQGTGTALASTDGMIGNYVAYDWSGKTSKLLSSS